MEWRVFEKGSQYRPGFLARLGLLLVSQVIFLFAALALVLFVPEERAEFSIQAKQVDGLFGQIERIMGDSSSAMPAAGVEQQLAERLNTLVASASQLSTLAVIQVSPITRRLYAWQSPEHASKLFTHESEMDSSQIASLVELMTNMPHGYRLRLNEHELHPLYLQRVDSKALGKVVIAGAGVSDRVASSKSTFWKTLPLLFLASTLISLLIVYLLWKRYQKPLTELAHVVETTAGTEPGHNRRAAAEEEEIARLTDGFERLADSRERDLRAIREADQRFEEAHDALVESRMFLQAIIDRSPSGMVVTDSVGNVVIFNRAAAESFGYQENEVLGQPVTRLFAPPAQMNDRASAAGFEVVCWRKDRESFPAFVVSAEIGAEDSQSRSRIYILRDIADSRSYQDMMVRLDRNVTRGAMAADIGHEINNFLAVLLGNLELLPRSIAKGDEPGIKKKLDTMKTNVDKIARFADGLMVDSSHEELQCTSMSLNQIVENVIAFLRDQNRFDGVDWVVQLRPDLPMAEIDDARVQQVLVNLLYNAAESLGDVEGNHVITVATKPSTRDGATVVHLDVIDNGPGVQRDKESLLFQSRFTTKKKGHGFGLMTCGRIVAQHRGRIGYMYENGAHFWFEMPLVQSPAATASPAMAVPTSV